MKSKGFVLAGLLAAILIGAGCSKSTTTTASPQKSSPAPSSTTTDTAATYPIGETSTTAEVQVQNGKTFTLAIPANESTGYQWVVTSGAGDVVNSLGSKYSTTATPALPGAGGTQNLSFQAQKVGTAQLVLGYQRPTTGEPAVKTVTVNVTVVEPGGGTIATGAPAAPPSAGGM